MRSQRKVSSPLKLTAKQQKGFRDKYSLYIYTLLPKELTEALNTIIHSKRGAIVVRTVLSYKNLSLLMFLHGPALHFSVHFGWLVCR